MLDLDESIKYAIEFKSYKTKEFIENDQCMQGLITYLQQMEVNSKSVDLIISLIKFFKFPILIFLASFYKKLDKDKLTFILQYEVQLKSIGSISKILLDNHQIKILSFLLKAGIDPRKFKQPILSRDEQIFIELIFELDEYGEKICDGLSQKSEAIIKKQLESIENRKKSEMKRKLYYLESQNLKTSKAMIMEKIEKNIHFVKEEKQVVFGKDHAIIEIEKGFQIIDEQAATAPLCCRTYFYQNQIIKQPESLTIQYKNYYYPYRDSAIVQILLKTVCGFLNGFGGIIYIGIKQSIDSKKRIVDGSFYNQAIKEDVLRDLRIYFQKKIEPDIVNNTLFKIEFVPIKYKTKPFEYMPGKYILKIRIKAGHKNQLYSFKGFEANKFAFRTENEVLTRKIGQNVLETYRQRILGSQKIAPLVHSGPCKYPELGKIRYDDKVHEENKIHQIEQAAEEEEVTNKIFYKLKDEKKQPKSTGRDNFKKQKPKEKNYYYVIDHPNDKLFFEKNVRDFFQKQLLFSKVQVSTIQNSLLIVIPKQLGERNSIESKIMKKNMSLMKDMIKISLEIYIRKNSDRDLVTQIFKGRKILTSDEKLGEYKFASIREAVLGYEALSEMQLKLQFLYE